jgi:hypothetical protein
MSRCLAPTPLPQSGGLDTHTLPCPWDGAPSTLQAGWQHLERQGVPPMVLRADGEIAFYVRGRGGRWGAHEGPSG